MKYALAKLDRKCSINLLIVRLTFERANARITSLLETRYSGHIFYSVGDSNFSLFSSTHEAQ